VRYIELQHARSPDAAELSGTAETSCWRMRYRMLSAKSRRSSRCPILIRARRPPSTSSAEWHRPLGFHTPRSAPICLNCNASGCTADGQPALLLFAIQEDDVKIPDCARAPSDEDLLARSSAAPGRQVGRPRDQLRQVRAPAAPHVLHRRLAVPAHRSLIREPPSLPNQPDFADSAVDIPGGSSPSRLRRRH